ncbi:phosphoenolpyruvate carboxykinase (GTP) [Plasticicumulans sp.]|uniref:phosphoenolpyruvate carboxykinase (GTP) n=1 Tax=Plasticicumulans sp. TaxID=2307179 RepID=UPI002CF43AAC|nr:phosphoenolpyruvate carboxykinase (GTP) [Plasticicumulans sp.]MBS0602266.1 phosphoenolpyruvate carboxykinase (GTP) [Pseudomonadota bacterium]HMV37734.1 phosphoenolpyruvate carboxykinase (GTP) [Plasticicumulans sp.]HMW29821.1 phosphoenolpyruvate carboxykinase (GTP) [Plasticicumulans sp.]HMW42744.1 phosphoenolpyruvate carboxykinase (GTP) [Plasticicumulans sp.]HMX52343.1 phosphoenolpyruvate carboxykinase (GTP) [Plasticicumulans sp.]
MSTTNQALQAWVEEVARLTRPDRIHWCDGSEAEYRGLVELMLGNGDLVALNQETHPNCYLHRSSPTDVARTEHLTFICTQDREDAGPNNNWIAPDEAHAKIDSLFDGCMQGRTLYVVPYCMGPIDSPLSRCGVEITDSPYVVANMRIMTRMGAAALARIEREGGFVKGLHSTGDLSPERRFIMHFPEELTIKSIGSGYGGNALLGKKCHALRIGSWQARSEGWLAEHMLIVGIENPQGETHYVAAAFPSACGKTNLAMLIPPATMPGWKVWTVGDDIAWLHLREDGRLWAINPEAGFFGVAPGTGAKTNRNALEMLDRDTIFTNVAVTADQQPWWEGKNKDQTPVIDWKGNPFDAAKGPAAHPNSRFTVSAKQCASVSPRIDDPAGVPISAIVFGGRRAELAPLVFQARDWKHGVLVGASVASETTAAATGAVGVVRRDPMAMQPFCGYNFADYWGHWLSFADKSDKLPKIFHVNWFRQDADGQFMWPGFGENLRVLKWILERCAGQAEAVDTPIGPMPRAEDIDTASLDVSPETLEALLSIDAGRWQAELEDIRTYFAKYGEHMPRGLWEEFERTRIALEKARSAETA